MPLPSVIFLIIDRVRDAEGGERKNPQRQEGRGHLDEVALGLPLFIQRKLPSYKDIFFLFSVKTRRTKIH